MSALRLSARPKYRNKRVTDARGSFDSKGEAKRYAELVTLQMGGQIRNLKRQVRYKLHGARGGFICAYEADFDYEERRADGAWAQVTEDFKGFRTRDFIIKKALFEDEYQRPLLETRAPRGRGRR